jgi:hypothetical protein
MTNPAHVNYYRKKYRKDLDGLVAMT